MTPQCGVRAAEDRARRRDRIPYAVPKNPTRKSWIFSFVPTGTTSFDRRSTSFRAKREHHYSFLAQMNEVVLCTNDVLRNDVTPCGVNDVALRANGAVAVRSVR